MIDLVRVARQYIKVPIDPIGHLCFPFKLSMTSCGITTRRLVSVKDGALAGGDELPSVRSPESEHASHNQTPPDDNAASALRKSSKIVMPGVLPSLAAKACD